ncbi:MAG TPA: acyl carrier protein [Ferruginibacter sp.]|nr:acyl carrier protein [Ferruginibacter sp.]
MQKEEIVKKLTPVFRKVFSDNSLEITDSLSALDVENWDSLSHMLLISEVENEFSIKFKLKDLNKMANVGDMIAIISSKL